MDAHGQNKFGHATLQLAYPDRKHFAHTLFRLRLPELRRNVIFVCSDERRSESTKRPDEVTA